MGKKPWPTILDDSFQRMALEDSLQRVGESRTPACKSRSSMKGMCRRFSECSLPLARCFVVIDDIAPALQRCKITTTSPQDVKRIMQITREGMRVCAAAEATRSCMYCARWHSLASALLQSQSLIPYLVLVHMDTCIQTYGLQRHKRPFVIASILQPLLFNTAWQL